MTVAAAVGLRRALPAGRTRTWAPVLLAAYGGGLLGAGIFRADPAPGFPVGTPETTTVSWHGALHFAIGGLGFGCLIAACLILGRHFARTGERGLAWFSRVTGVVFLAGFAGIASGSHGPPRSRSSPPSSSCAPGSPRSASTPTARPDTHLDT